MNLYFCLFGTLITFKLGRVKISKSPNPYNSNDHSWALPTRAVNLSSPEQAIHHKLEGQSGQLEAANRKSRAAGLQNEWPASCDAN